MKGRGTTCVFPRRQQQCGRRRRTGTGMPSPPFGPAIIAISAGPGAGCPANRCQEWTTAPGAFRCCTDRHPGRESPHGPCCARGAGRCWPVLTGAVGEPGLLGTLLQGRCGSLDREALENLADCAQPEGWSRSRAVFSGQSDSFCLLHESRIWAIVRSDDRPATSNVLR